MRTILSKHDLRHLELLEFLIKNKHQWTLLKTISNHLATPLRTLQNDIQEINVYIHPLTIQSSSSGIKMAIPKNCSERYVYKKILEASIDFQLIEYVFMHEGETLQSLAETFHLSESTIKRMIKKINESFQDEEFSIQSTPVSFIGEEALINQFMSCYFYEKYFFPEEYLTKNEINLILKLINKTLNDLGKDLYFPNFKRVFTRVHLNCVRLRNKHDIPLIPGRFFSNDILNDNQFCSEFFETFQLQLTPLIIQKLFHIFSYSDYFFSIEELHNKILINEQQNILYNELKNVLSNISNQFNIPLKSSIENKLLLDLVNIINLRDRYCHHLFILYNQKGRFLSQLSKNYNYVSDMIKTHLISNISLEFNESDWNELNYILLTHWTDLYEKFRFIETPIQIFLVIDTDMEHGFLIKRELETYSRFNIQVEVMTDPLLTQLQLLTKDQVLITNIPTITHINCELLCFEEFLGNQEWQMLDDIFKRIIANRKN